MVDMRSNRFKSNTQGLIAQHGKTRVYEAVGAEVYNQETQTVETTTTLYTIKMFETEPKYREVKSPNLVDKKLTAYLIATCDLPTKPKAGDKITDIYLGVEDSVEVLEVTHYEAQGEVCMWRALCVRV